MIKSFFALSGAVVVALGLAACAYSQASVQVSASTPRNFEQDIQPILSEKCTSCHGASKASKKLRLDSWKYLFDGADDGEAVIPYDADNSLLVEITARLAGGKHPSELDGDTLTSDEVRAIRNWIETGAKNKKGAVPYADSKNLLYACNQDDATVSVIDMDANVVIRTVDLQKLGFSPNAKPHHVAVEPGGEHWYVSLIGDDVVLKFNRQNELVGRTDFERPGLLLADPDRNILLVGRSMKAVNPPQRLGVIDRETMEVDELDVFISRPHALALSVDGRFLYTASLAANQVVTMNRETEKVDLYNVPGPVHTLVQFAVSPDGTTLAVGGQMTGMFLFFDLENPDAPEVVDSIRVAAQPWHPIYSADGEFIYFGNKGADKVTVVNAEARAVAAVISGRGIAEPHGSALSPDGEYLYISSNNTSGSYIPRYDLGDNSNVGTVAVIDTESRRIVKVIEVGRNASGLGAAKEG